MRKRLRKKLNLKEFINYGFFIEAKLDYSNNGKEDWDFIYSLENFLWNNYRATAGGSGGVRYPEYKSSFFFHISSYSKYWTKDKAFEVIYRIAGFLKENLTEDEYNTLIISWPEDCNLFWYSSNPNYKPRLFNLKVLELIKNRRKI